MIKGSSAAIALALFAAASLESSRANAGNTNYYYDATGQLIGTSGDASQINGYVYDAVGNRTYFGNNPTKPPTQSGALLSGQILIAGDWITTTGSNGHTYTFNMQEDGNLVLYDASTPIWATGTSNKNVSFVTMQGDGNLVMYDPQFNAVWSSKTSGNSGANLYMQANGNVIISNGGGTIWATNTSGQ